MPFESENFYFTRGPFGRVALFLVAKALDAFSPNVLFLSVRRCLLSLQGKSKYKTNGSMENAENIQSRVVFYFKRVKIFDQVVAGLKFLCLNLERVNVSPI